MYYDNLDDSGSDSDSTPLNDGPKAPPTKKWDQFQEIPPQIDTGSAAINPWFRRAEKVLLFCSYIIAFCVVLGTCVVCKGTTFFMFSQISMTRTNLPFCNGDINSGVYINNAGDKSFEVNFNCQNLTSSLNKDCDEQRGIERSAWLWAIFFAYSFPQVGAFLRSLRICLFKFQHFPELGHFLFVFTMEMLHTAGLTMLAFLVLPEMDALRGIVLTAGFAMIPSMLLPFTRFKRSQEENDRVKENPKQNNFLWASLLLDFLAAVAQLSAVLFWPVMQGLDGTQDLWTNHLIWSIPASLVLVSCGWWETYAEENTGGSFGGWLWKIKENMLKKSRYATYLVIIPFRLMLFFGGMILITYFNGNVTNENEDIGYWDIFFKGFLTSFGNHTYQVVEVIETTITSNSDPFADGFQELTITELPISDNLSVVYVLIIQITTGYGAYIFSKFASKVQIQTFSFALPISCVIPACIALLISGCGARSTDKCTFYEIIPDNLFFECPKIGDFLEYAWSDDVWIFLVWFISYLWISLHIWYPKSPRLASSEQIFGTPWYESLFIDQSLVLNRRKDGETIATVEDLEFELGLNDEDVKDDYEVFPDKEESESKHSSIKDTDKVTRIYACATMWHETKEEIMEMLKSLFRIDQDYSSRRIAQKYFGTVDPDFYEWETHIFFDDCMEVSDSEEQEQVVNKFVRLLVSTINEAGSHHYGKKMKVRPCKKYPTPYGGRLVWTLPGKTKIVCHLKDKDKIRHKKRWSQCMYMYYLLGYKLMELPISDDRKAAKAENTYILALDGDIDFQPDAIIRLVDLMKKNKQVGAACGRIHPTGSGFMPWFQMFEYAVGHWFQKATEHILGCVLCSPGCFSLFRGLALMDHNVMRRYTTVPSEARHYVQYDQGEDRWLCTLLLQQGWRVEYSAASDAYTACPVTFEEFYNQRRRWLPSTIMNILDLLGDYKNVVNNNPDISILYIAYQGFLMLSTFIGPGSIYMILAGSLNTVFGLTYWPDALLYNLIPIALFCFACYYLDSKVQLSFAKMLTVGYVLIMLAVMIGICIQIAEDGSIWSPSGLGFLSIVISFVLAAVIHPYEFYCLPYFFIYWITVPSMYLLLVIYSLFNLWNVSWGTREVAQKKTKKEMEEDKKRAEEEQKNAKKEGLMGNFLGKLNMGGGGGGGEKGGVEFNMANLFRCMCFTHDDPHDPKKQLVQIASSLETVNKRLSNMESSHDYSGYNRRSSLGRGRGMSMVKETIEDDTEDLNDTASEVSTFVSPQLYEDKIQRDPEVNPLWLDEFFPNEAELGGGPIDFLPGSEIIFWRELIAKYLTPLQMTDVQKKEQMVGLKAYRDQLIFTFIMINTIWVLAVTLMQQQKDLMSLPWPFVNDYNFTYTSDTEQGPEIIVGNVTLSLEPIGMMFMAAFIGVLVLQMIGMFMHRWTNLCHTIATTKLDWCERKAQDYTDDGDVDKNAVYFVKEIQNQELKEPEKKQEILSGRRNTIHQLSNYHKKAEEEGEEINLEKQFRKRLESKDLGINEDLMRKMSLRRGTLAALENRRQSYVNLERRRSSAFPGMRSSFSQMGILNNGFDSDLGESMTDISGASTYRGSELGRNSVQFDIATSKM